MSQENVAALNGGFEAFNSGDIGRILEFIHVDFEAVVPPAFSAEPDTYRGHDGVRRYFSSFLDAMDEVHFHAERFWHGGEMVVVAVRVTAKGKRTGIVVEQRFTQVWTIRDGKAMSVRAYASPAEALAAAGLSE
ncbi:MAG TPA: nuclear transport factor 2 family protein [Solirubrobacteraceae bacterium]|jgi:ketosteroid isomerase-like protein|nr:nuclear transport factor 2 family protein [Solirubrobacteraceae bacterium]